MPNVPRVPPTFEVERRWLAAGKTRIAGVDEVGVGAIAGPLVAAAVVLPLTGDLDELRSLLAEVRDSNHTKRYKQERLTKLIEEVAGSDTAVGIVEVAEIEEIDDQNRAAQLARDRALDALPKPIEVVLLDGGVEVGGSHFDVLQVPKVVGGTPSLSIAAASIVARVERGRIMVSYADEYPGWGFERHSGYPSPQHLAALQELAITPVHHRNHRLVREASSQGPYSQPNPSPSRSRPNSS